jgi:hypothetical protein
MRLRTLHASAVALCVAVMVGNARAQSHTAPPFGHQAETADRLVVPRVPVFDGRFASPFAITRPALASTIRQTAKRNCRRSRRAWIGALVGAGAAVPVAKLAHDRFENEAANGAAAAATMVVLGAAVGAFIGLGTCQ